MRIDLAKDFTFFINFLLTCFHSSTVVILRAKSVEWRLEYVCLNLRRTINIILLCFPFIILSFGHFILFRYSRTFIYRKLHPHFSFHINWICLCIGSSTYFFDRWEESRGLIYTWFLRITPSNVSIFTPRGLICYLAGGRGSKLRSLSSPASLSKSFYICSIVTSVFCLG